MAENDTGYLRTGSSDIGAASTPYDLVRAVLECRKPAFACAPGLREGFDGV
jgi:hypothetical protein